VYSRDGLRALADTVSAEQRTAPERLFVRVVGLGTDALVLSDVDGWDPATLETSSIRLSDGTLVQVGKSTEARTVLLARFRAALERLRATAEMGLATVDDPERSREALADCVEETDRVLAMLNTLMDISEAESGAMALRREPVPLTAVAARVVDLYRDVAEAKG